FHTVEHSISVSSKAVALAHRFEIDAQKAKTAGILHDISTVFPIDSRIPISEYFGIVILPEERQVPMLLHQKLSRELAHTYFGIGDEEILNSIACHTTLRGNATRLDMAVFLADKIDWDQEGEPPYLNEITKGLSTSLEAGAATFIQYLVVNKHLLKVVHPWLMDAFYHLQRVESKF
ncbi:MAG: bis(5'-nucleosyl)-tetraphosphatase (symmetrical) YqeK, partial [Treponemataceae bacterium]